MICSDCGNAYKDFSSTKGRCKSCREKRYSKLPHRHDLYDSIKDSIKIVQPHNIGRGEGFKYSFIRETETIPDSIAEHLKVCEELNKLYEKKNNDYGDSFSGTFKEFGLTMSAIRLQDKLERFKRLSKDSRVQKVNDESIRDTLVDLANYAIMTVMEIDKNGKK